MKKLRFLRTTAISALAVLCAGYALATITPTYNTADSVRMSQGGGPPGSGPGYWANFATLVNSVVGSNLSVLPCNGGNIAVASGFGTNAAISYTGSNCSFQMTSGTTAASNGVLTLPSTAPHGWYCSVADETTQSNALQQTKITNSTNTTATIDGFQSNSAAGNWAANDIIAGSCTPY